MKNEEWFKDNFRYLHIRLIEKELMFPYGTLQKWIQGERGLNASRLFALNEFVDKLLVSSLIKEEFVEEKSIIDVVEKNIIKKKIKEPKLPVEVKEKLNKELNTIIENKNTINVPIDMTTVDVATGEIKEKLVPARIQWSFYKQLYGLVNMVEHNIYSDGTNFEVRRNMGNTEKYAFTDSIDNARRIVNAKNPLLVELSIQ